MPAGPDHFVPLVRLRFPRAAENCPRRSCKRNESSPTANGPPRAGNISRRPAGLGSGSYGGHALLGGDTGRWGGFCDEEGLSHAIGLQQDAYCVVAQERTLRFAGRRVSSPQGEPVETLRVIVRTTARARHLTVGKDRRPVARAAVCLFSETTAPAAATPRTSGCSGTALPISLAITHYGETDEQGHFEFFSTRVLFAHGRDSPFHVRLIGTDSVSTSALLDEGANEFEVTNQGEVEVDLHQDRPLEVALEGRVVLASDCKTACRVPRSRDNQLTRETMGISDGVP